VVSLLNKWGIDELKYEAYLAFESAFENGDYKAAHVIAELVWGVKSARAQEAIEKACLAYAPALENEKFKAAHVIAELVWGVKSPQAQKVIEKQKLISEPV
jgi:hypothetical protein